MYVILRGLATALERQELWSGGDLRMKMNVIEEIVNQCHEIGKDATVITTSLAFGHQMDFERRWLSLKAKAAYIRKLIEEFDYKMPDQKEYGEQL